jgi:hypothetical protein
MTTMIVIIGTTTGGERGLFEDEGIARAAPAALVLPEQALIDEALDIAQRRIVTRSKGISTVQAGQPPARVTM